MWQSYCVKTSHDFVHRIIVDIAARLFYVMQPSNDNFLLWLREKYAPKRGYNENDYRDDKVGMIKMNKGAALMLALSWLLLLTMIILRKCN